MKKLICLFLLGGLMAQAQTKPQPGKAPAGGNKPAAAPASTTAAAPVNPADTLDPRDVAIKEGNRFAVYSKRGRSVAKDKKLKLCIQLVHPEATLNYCVNDSVLKDPEKYKVLFERQDGDTNYVLVYMDAFTKVPEKISCLTGKETKLYFVRWNVKTNKAIWKPRIVSSCMRGITNMTESPIESWDGSEPLVINYYRGGTNFIEIRFDPSDYKAGFKASGDNEKEP